MIEAINEAERTPILAKSAIKAFLMARPVTKSDMVKPIPPKNPKPKICFQFTPVGKEAILKTVASHEKRRIPTGLPITSPSTTPIETGELKKLKSALVEFQLQH